MPFYQPVNDYERYLREFIYLLEHWDAMPHAERIHRFDTLHALSQHIIEQVTWSYAI